jgi:hypothetical protein
MARGIRNVLRLLTGVIPMIAAQLASAQNCALPIPFQYEFQSGATAALSATSVTEPCALSIALNSGSGPTASGFMHYRRASPTMSVRYGFRIDTSALTNLTLANHVVQLFSASSPVVLPSPLSVSHLLRLELVGGTTAQLRFIAALGGDLPAITNVSLSQTVNTIRVEINVGSGAAGSVQYWINHAFTDPPDGVIDNAGAGLDNAAWVGVIAAEIGLSSPSTQFRADNAGNAVVFDQIESSDDILFWDDFSTGGQQ